MVMADKVVEKLNEGTISARRARPGETMMELSRIVAAVSTEKAAVTECTQTVLVQVLAPGSFGASQCEDKALEVAEVLQQMNCQVDVGSCSLDGRTGLFTVPVRAVFILNPVTVYLAGERLNYLTAFRSQRGLEGIVDDISIADWTFRVEEFFPAGVAPGASAEEPFTIVTDHLRLGGCSLTFWQRISEPGGIRQIREGTASNWLLE